jgi:putative transposase
MYRWRKLSPEDRERILLGRQRRGYPWHSPPHRPSAFTGSYHISAANYEHRPIMGASPERMDSAAEALLAVCEASVTQVHAWCLLPNHYHLLVSPRELEGFLEALGRTHGRLSHRWNGEDRARGRKIFFRAADREIRGEAHRWATINYIHHNPVHHGYARQWQDWPWSSARGFLAAVGYDEALRLWRAYPLRDYGAKWDSAER